MNNNKTSTSGGLSTDTWIVQEAGMYYLSAQTNMTTPSGLIITLAQTGSVSSSVSTPTMSAQATSASIQKTFNCAVNDVLTAVLTSSAPADQPPSLIKTTINLRNGSV